MEYKTKANVLFSLLNIYYGHIVTKQFYKVQKIQSFFQN